MSSSLTYLNTMLSPLTESKPSLLHRLNMDSKSLSPSLESERLVLKGEVKDMMNLTGIIPITHEMMKSMTSLTRYPRKVTKNNKKADSLESLSQKMTTNQDQMMNQIRGDALTRNSESMNHKCHASMQNNTFEEPVQTLAAIKPKIFLTSSKETHPLSSVGSGVPQVHQQDSLAQSGMHSSRENLLTSTPSSACSLLHHIHSIDEGVRCVGSTEIQFERPKPAAKVETSGQWTSAYNLVIKATAFLFPHRYDKLRSYRDYIEELFSAKSATIHLRLFSYDEAVRYKVGQGQNILLTDREAFVWYYEAIVTPDGARFEEASGGSKSSQEKSGKSREKSDICHQFNGVKGCDTTVNKCKYKHTCQKCKQCGHGKMDCKVNEKV